MGSKRNGSDSSESTMKAEAFDEIERGRVQIRENDSRRPSISRRFRNSSIGAAMARRRAKTSNTVRTSSYQPLGDIPGAEPGINPNELTVKGTDLYTECQITVVDFSQDTVEQEDFCNADFIKFLEKDRPSWSKVRWINVNGLSWDVISGIGKKWKLHGLALEDLLASNTRTKSDWYTDHAFVVLPLMKLVQPPEHVRHHLDKKAARKRYWKSLLYRLIGVTREEEEQIRELRDRRISLEEEGLASDTDLRNQVKTLHRFHGGPNLDRILYMEKHSVLSLKQLAVSVEQVSIFMTLDGTVISFFENSADDIEPPILARLTKGHTVLRELCDPSMMLQAIVDAIIDLAFPVMQAYQDAIGDLELEVLTDPRIFHTSQLYILTSELAMLKGTLQPVAALISSLKAHRKGVNGIVDMSDVARVYLGDVEDHCLVMMQSLDTMKRSASNMIDLIFNTVGALQNESMKQLTLVTVLFMPLTFLTGYFGMNFETFPAIKHGDYYFWIIAVPALALSTLFLMRERIGRQVVERARKKDIKFTKKNRMKGGFKGGFRGWHASDS